MTPEVLVVTNLKMDPKWNLFTIQAAGTPMCILRIDGVDHWLPVSSMTVMRDTLTDMLENGTPPVK